MDSEKLNYSVHTFGCKVNTYDTGLMQKRLGQNGFSEEKNTPQIHIINSCAVTQEATKEAVRLVRRLKAKDPLSTVVVTGCSAQVDGGLLDHLPGADLIVANSHKGELEALLKKFYRGELKEKVFRSNIFRKEDLGMGGGVEAHHTRSFLKIQDGCNSFCSFCIIPFARGTSQSLPSAVLIEKINELYKSGVREVVLTGVHIGDYAESLEGQARGLEDLILDLLNFTKMPRFRLGSLEPIELTEKLLTLFKNPRLMPHFHMSIQSGDTRVLHAMKRKYTAEDVERALFKIEEQVPGAFVGMDVIVGFPGETEVEFQNTVNVLSRTPWSRIHVFPYSERQGTKATLISEVVPQELRKARGQILKELSLERLRQEAVAQVGRRKKILLLKNRQGQVDRGLSRDYWTCFLDHAVELGSEELEVEVVGYDESSLHRHEGYLRAKVLESL